MSRADTQADTRADDAALLEAGRLLFAGAADFLSSAPTVVALPP
ncbi:MAG: YihA family ribosome biogenesis GTP-binding protein, partial [Methylobacterium sp.]